MRLKISEVHKLTYCLVLEVICVHRNEGAACVSIKQHGKMVSNAWEMNEILSWWICFTEWLKSSLSIAGRNKLVWSNMALLSEWLKLSWGGGNITDDKIFSSQHLVSTTQKFASRRKGCAKRSSEPKWSLELVPSCSGHEPTFSCCLVPQGATSPCWGSETLWCQVFCSALSCVTITTKSKPTAIPVVPQDQGTSLAVCRRSLTSTAHLLAIL